MLVTATGHSYAATLAQNLYPSTTKNQVQKTNLNGNQNNSNAVSFKGLPIDPSWIPVILLVCAGLASLAFFKK